MIHYERVADVVQCGGSIEFVWWSYNGIHGPVVRVYQLPVEGSSGESAVLTEQSAVVLCLCLYAQSLHYLRQVDEVHELDRLVGAVYMSVCVCCGRVRCSYSWH